MPVPWTNPNPLMLAPMQGLTNRALRAVFAKSVRPDVLFTEFVRVRPEQKTLIANSDFTEALSVIEGTPLVVQIIGGAEEGVVQAAKDLVHRGVEHINVNMGCPFGRMTSILAGGGMFRHPQSVEPMLSKLRSIVPGSLSVKTRLGIDDENEVFELLSSFENAGLDFLVVHARTVRQKYHGEANHERSAEIIRATSLPVIVNGDVRDEKRAHEVLEQTKAAGLMLGRGAIADPLLFARIRGLAPTCPRGTARKKELAGHLERLLLAYREVFCGEAQILSRWKENLAHVDDPELKQWKKKLKKAKQMTFIEELLRQAQEENV